MANRWLVKTEPSAYSFEDLVREGRTAWTGVNNAQARIHLRAMKSGDLVLVYHTGGVKAVVGIAKVAKAPYADPAGDDPKAVVVDLVPVRPLATPVPLSVLRERAELHEWDLLRMGRLSVLPVPTAAWRAVESLSATRP
jgi:predicted RNA-binding protein with PUA-like domain